MKKLVATGAIAVLMLTATSPAFADTIVISDDGDDGNLNVEVFDASQFQVAGALQVNTGSAVAGADDDSFAAAGIDQSLSVTQFQFNGGF